MVSPLPVSKYSGSKTNVILSVLDTLVNTDLVIYSFKVLSS